MRKIGRPVTLEWIAEVVMAAKGLPDDKRLRKHVIDAKRQALIRMERRTMVRRRRGGS
jgi:hypothetical protein